MNKLRLSHHLAADESGGKRLIRITLDASNATILHLHQNGTHVGTIVRTDGSDNVGHFLHRLH
jgi:hypothetical protein